MPYTLKLLETCLSKLLDAKQAILDDLSDVSLVDDNDSIVDDYMLILKRILKNICETKRTIRLVEELTK